MALFHEKKEGRSSRTVRATAHAEMAKKNPTEYVNVTAYQERIEPEPSELQLTPVQGELELIVTSSEQCDSDKQNSSSGGE
jgi:hypothetical protein